MIDNILKEIDSNTYEEIGDVITVVEEQTRNYIEAGWTVTPENQKLPMIYATPKMHKNPVKFRYIIAAKTCVLKPMAQELTKILKLVLKVLRNYCEKIRIYTGANRMWITESTSDILEDVNKINAKKKPKSIETFDFSTLYTMIDQNDLSEKLKWAVDKAFSGGTNQWIRVSRNDATFHNGKKKMSGKLYSKDEVHVMIDTVINNALFTFGDKVFRQVIGIPMGTDPAPFMANLYLFYYEFHFMKDLTSKDYTSARRLYGHTRRFIDDLATLNNFGHLKEHWSEIYPKELTLNEENDDSSRATFLDLDIEVQDNVFQTKIFDKRDAFKFEIVNYPDIRGNIPENQAYGVVIGQLLRIARNTSKSDEFLCRCGLVIKKLINKGYDRARLENACKKCIRRHQVHFTKYDLTTEETIHKIFSKWKEDM